MTPEDKRTLSTDFFFAFCTLFEVATWTPEDKRTQSTDFFRLSYYPRGHHRCTDSVRGQKNAIDRLSSPFVLSSKSLQGHRRCTRTKERCGPTVFAFRTLLEVIADSPTVYEDKRTLSTDSLRLSYSPRGHHRCTDGVRGQKNAVDRQSSPFVLFSRSTQID